MSKNKKKKTGLQRDVSSIFKGIPIPPKKGYNSGKPSKESEPENSLEKPYNHYLYTPDKQQNLPVEKPDQTSTPKQNNITQQFSEQSVSESAAEIPYNQTLYTPDRRPNLPVQKPEQTISSEDNITIQPQQPEPESKDDIPPKPSSEQPQKYTGTLIQKLNEPAPVEDNKNQKKQPEESVQKQAGDIPLKPAQNQTQKPNSSLIQKLNQPPELLRKNTPARKIVADVADKTDEPHEIITMGPWQQLKNKLLTPKPGVSPARQKATVILIPVLAVAFVFVLRQVFWSAPEKSKGADKDSFVSQTSDSGTDIAWKFPEPYPSKLRDPMFLIAKNPEKTTPEQVDEGTEMTITVKGVLYSEDNPAALIGNKIVHVGDIVSGAKVIGIDKDSVTFEINGKRWKEIVRQ